jgi:hypothetical protein
MLAHNPSVIEKAETSENKTSNIIFMIATIHIEDDFDSPGALKVLVEAARTHSTGLDAMVTIFGLRY